MNFLIFKNLSWPYPGLPNLIGIPDVLTKCLRAFTKSFLIICLINCLLNVKLL
jgi:hypothetical protein